jgi:beta-phosphoglucomutase
LEIFKLASFIDGNYMAEKWAIIWDLDGVIVDTTELHYQSWTAVLPKYGIEYSKETFLSTFGMNNQAIINILMDHPSLSILEEISHKKEAWLRENIPGNIELLPGVKDWLQRFKDWGFLQGIASSAPQANVLALTKVTDISSYFDVLESAETLPSKPDPTIFLKVAGLLLTPVNRCLVIEDAPAGIEGARRAGIKCLAVATTHPASDLTGANLIVERLDQLNLQTIQQLFGMQ